MNRILMTATAFSALLLVGCEEQKNAAQKAAKDAAAGAATKAVEAAKEKVAELADAAKKTVESYLGDLGSASALLEGIKTPADATKHLPDIKSIGEKLGAANTTLGALGEDAKKQITSMFGPQIESAVGKVKAQIDRLTKDATLGPVLGDALKNFKFFQ